MNGQDDYNFFKLRRQAKTYITKVFRFNAWNTECVRQVRMVIEGNDRVHLGEIDGVMCLRLTGAVRKTQVSALVTQDDKKIKRLTLQTFKTRAGDWIEAVEKEEFSFRTDEFNRLLSFLHKIEFIDLSNSENFQIEDISTKAGPKAIIDASDREIVSRIKTMTEAQRNSLLQTLQQSLTPEEINILLGRKQGIQEYEEHIQLLDWSEVQWQDFFDREQWVFGYGLDYRMMRQFDREMTVGAGGSDNRNKPVIDFLMSFTDYTVLVEIKTPSTPIFATGRRGRAGTWEFSRDFMSAVSQIIEQKAEWLSFAQTGEHYNRSGTEHLTARTRNAKTILVIGSRDEFSKTAGLREANIMRDTFELFRRESRSIDIVTFDELLERARFITRSQ
ncbi:Shedu immune nuclease family protein [Bradyrhizobium sp. GCM10028915]|uniref:Shedu immune nuclease family protein n=1 Tax=Bradyrhizobium sp. GCM10028915 TaxID=3273385 RepID=UPI003613D787